jgi:hypothetical protein
MNNEFAEVPVSEFREEEKLEEMKLGEVTKNFDSQRVPITERDKNTKKDE